MTDNLLDDCAEVMAALPPRRGGEVHTHDQLVASLRSALRRSQLDADSRCAVGGACIGAGMVLARLEAIAGAFPEEIASQIMMTATEVVGGAYDLLAKCPEAVVTIAARGF